MEFSVAQQFLIACVPPSSLDLKIGIACAVLDHLSENRCETKYDVAIVRAN